MSGLGDLLLPDWVAKRKQKEELEEFLDNAAKQEAEQRIHDLRISKRADGGKQAKRNKRIRNDHLANKRARKARRRNRVG